MIKIKYSSTHTGNTEYNVTNNKEYVVLQMVQPADYTSITAIILDDNNHLYVTANAVNGSSGAWTLTYVSVPFEEVLYSA